MKVSPTILFLVGSCVIFLFSPYLPNTLLTLTVGNRAGSLVILLAVLYVARENVVLGLAGFLAAAALFLESRRRTVTRVAVALQAEKPVFHVEQLEKPAPDLIPGEVHPPRDAHEVEDYSFEPSEETGSNKFEAVGDSHDEKQPLDTVPSQPGEVSEFLQAKGLANIH